MRFARGSLPIGKNSPIEPFNHTVNNRSGCIVVYFGLSTGDIEDSIEGECEGLGIAVFLGLGVSD